MKFILVVLLVIVGVFFVWQLVLFIRDIVKKIKARKIKKAVDNKSANDDKLADDNSARKE